MFEPEHASGSQGGLRWIDEDQTLQGWAHIGGREIFVNLPRETIHSELSIYNDAIGWEIERFKHDIVERLAPLLLQQLAQ